MKERIVIIFIAVTLGLLATTIGFFLYESSKPAKSVQESNQKENNQTKPANRDEVTLTIQEPKDEALTTNRSIRVKGKTDPQNTIIISTNQEDVSVSPTSQGDFSATISIDAGVNKFLIQAVSPNGNSRTITQTISFTAEQF